MSSKHDTAFKELKTEFGKSYMDSRDEKNASAQLRLTLVALGILAFAGYEAVRIMFRKNFGMTKQSWQKFALCLICFTTIAVISFIDVNSKDSFATETGSSDSHFITGIIYSILTITLLIKVFKDKSLKGNEHYLGESNVLSFLSRDGWSEKKIQNIAEPILTVTVGATFCLFDRLGGIPIIFCALSVWGNLVFESLFVDKSLEGTVNALNSELKQKKKYNRVNTEL